MHAPISDGDINGRHHQVQHVMLPVFLFFIQLYFRAFQCKYNEGNVINVCSLHVLQKAVDLIHCIQLVCHCFEC